MWCKGNRPAIAGLGYWRKGGRSQRMQMASRSWERQGGGLCLRDPAREHSPADISVSVQWDPCWAVHLGNSKIRNLYCLKAPTAVVVCQRCNVKLTYRVGGSQHLAAWRGQVGKGFFRGLSHFARKKSHQLLGSRVLRRAEASVVESCSCARNMSQQYAIKFENGKKRNVHPLLVDRKQTFPVLDSGFLVYSRGEWRLPRACHGWTSVWMNGTLSPMQTVEYLRGQTEPIIFIMRGWRSTSLGLFAVSTEPFLLKNSI